MKVFLEEMTERLAAGGLFMIPIVVTTVIMMSLVVWQVFALWRASRMFKTADRHSEGGLQRRRIAGFYLESRSGLPNMDRLLSESMSSAFVHELGRPKDILVCAATASVLGLLGTVSGMMTSFDAMQQLQIGDIRHMAAGVSEALITTQSGLMAAVVGVGLGKLLSIWRAHLKNKFERYLQHGFRMTEKGYAS